jgi:hypothetical protein
MTKMPQLSPIHAYITMFLLRLRLLNLILDPRLKAASRNNLLHIGG